MTSTQRAAVEAEPEWHRHSVAAQAVMRGRQGYRVRAVAPEAGVHGRGHVAIRIGRVLVYLEDRDAMDSLIDAVREARVYADRAYGPVLPAPSWAVR